MLVKNTVDHRIELFVVQIADKAAVAVYGVEPDLRADRADAGAYIEFSGTLPDTPKMRYSTTGCASPASGSWSR